MDFVYLVAELCRSWDERRPGTEQELESLRTAARRASGPDLVSAVEVLAEHGNALLDHQTTLGPLLRKDLS